MKEFKIPHHITVAAGQKTREKEYWTQRLDVSGQWSKTTFPTDYPLSFNRRQQEDSFKEVTFAITDRLFDQIIKLSQGVDYTLNLVLQAALLTLLYRCTGNDDIIIGSPIYRQQNKGEFLNSMLALRTSVSGDDSFKKLLLAVRETVKEATEYQNYPIELLAKELAPGSSGSRKDGFPYFDIIMLLQNIHDFDTVMNYIPLLVFHFNKSDTAIECTLKYDSSYYRQDTMERLCRYYVDLFEQTAFNIDAPVSQLTFLSPSETVQVLETFNDSSADYPRHSTLHELFQERAAADPNAVAIVNPDGKTTLTYRQVDDKTNRLARLLQQKGAGPGTVTAVMTGRSSEMIIAMLAVLKAGGAYLPIDPEAPPKRVLDMLTDSGAVALLAQEDIIKKRSYSILKGIHNIAFQPFMTPGRPQITDLSTLPFPDRSLIQYEKYRDHIGLMIVKNTFTLQATRGCPFKCAYCHKLWPKTHMVRPAEHIFQEVRGLYEKGVRRFAFVDDIFNLNIKNSRRFFELVIENGLKIQLFFGLRGDILTKEYIDLMIKAGTVRMALALETASPRLQKFISKNLKIERLRENLHYISQNYPHVILELQTMHGFPSETEEEALMTLNFIKSIKWLHFPYIHILKVYPNTDMEKLALLHHVSPDAIIHSEGLAFHELPDTLPFSKQFTKSYQADFLNNYFLNKERLLHVLPHQAKLLTEDEMVQKYNSYLPVDIETMDDFLRFAGLTREELGDLRFQDEATMAVPDLDKKLNDLYPAKHTGKDAINILLMDMSQYFSSPDKMLYDVVEPPLGLLYLATYLNRELAERVNVRVVKSRIDFDSYEDLKEMIQSFKPDIIGIRTLTFFKDFFHETAALIRQWGFQMPLVVGGPYGTTDYQTILQDPNVTLSIIGEGEITFTELIEKMLENNKQLPAEDQLKQVAGLAFVPDSVRNKPASPHLREVINLDDTRYWPGDETALNPVNASSDLAYVMFTSGSTGKPKGVMVEHRNALNTVTWFIRKYNLEAKRNILQTSHYTFDASVNQVFGTLISGSTLYLIDKKTLFDIQALRNYIDNHDIYLINHVPVMIKEVLGNHPKFEHLVFVVSGGEKLDETVKQSVLDKGYRLTNQYGPTETTIDALMSECTAGQPVTLGKPIANTRCFILDRDGNLAPLGIFGELCVSGDGVARGYLNRPELTDEKFTSIQLPGLKVDRLYRTGDLARWLRDGNIELGGRIDQQVKIRGNRVEPGEVENRLKLFSGLSEAVVIARNDTGIDGQPGADYLCAYYVAETPENDNDNSKKIVDPSALRKFLVDMLPDYMVPAHFIRLDKLPLMANGKINRAALPQPQQDTPSAEYVSPGDDIEKQLATAWQEVFGIDKVGVTENFFEIGGDSIKAIQVAARLHKAGLKLDIGELFLTPTIRELAKKVTVIQHKIPQGAVSGEVALTPIQHAFFNNNTKDLHHLNHAVMIFRPAGFDPSKVEAAFKKIAEHHDALRMIYTIDDKEIIQRNRNLEEGALVEIKTVDLKGHSDPAKTIEQVSNDIQASFDLSSGPLVKLGLFQTDSGDHLLMAFHHLIMDGISMRVIFEDLASVYARLESGKEPQEISLPDKTDSFQYWAAKINEYATSYQSLSELDYWKNIIQSDFEPLPVDSEIQPSERIVANTNTLDMTLDQDLTNDLIKNVHFAYNTEINDILLTTLSDALTHWCNRPRIAISLEGHGRESIIKDIDISRTVGWFTTQYPVILDTGSTADTGEKIKRVKETLRKIPNKGIGYGILRYLLNPQQRGGIELNIQPDINFNYLGQFGQEKTAPADNPSHSTSQHNSIAFEMSPMKTGESRGKDIARHIKIDINGMIINKRLRFRFEYNILEYREQSVNRFMNCFKESLTRVIQHCVSKESSELTPSDVGNSNLSIEDFKTIENIIN